LNHSSFRSYEICFTEAPCSCMLESTYLRRRSVTKGFYQRLIYVSRQVVHEVMRAIYTFLRGQSHNIAHTKPISILRNIRQPNVGTLRDNVRGSIVTPLQRIIHAVNTSLVFMCSLMYQCKSHVYEIGIFEKIPIRGSLIWFFVIITKE